MVRRKRRRRKRKRRKKNRRRNSETERKRKRKGHSPRVFVSSRDSRRRVSDVDARGGARRRQRLVDGSFVVDVFFFFYVFVFLFFLATLVVWKRDDSSL